MGNARDFLGEGEKSEKNMRKMKMARGGNSLFFLNLLKNYKFSRFQKFINLIKIPEKFHKFLLFHYNFSSKLCTILNL